MSGERCAAEHYGKCGQLLDAANGSFMKKGDALDVQSRWSPSRCLRWVTITTWVLALAKNQTLAAAWWYAKSAALALKAPARRWRRANGLYVEPEWPLPQNPVKATAVLDGYMKTFGPYPKFSDPDQKDFANTYTEIGEVYEKVGGAQMTLAIAVYFRKSRGPGVIPTQFLRWRGAV